MSVSQGKNYLVHSLTSLLPAEAVEGVTEYLLTLDSSANNKTEIVNTIVEFARGYNESYSSATDKVIDGVVNQYIALCNPSTHSNSAGNSYDRSNSYGNSNSNSTGSRNKKKNSNSNSNRQEIVNNDANKSNSNTNSNNINSQVITINEVKKDRVVLCNCMATQHPFVTSCVSCGWILCEFQHKKGNNKNSSSAKGNISKNKSNSTGDSTSYSASSCGSNSVPSASDTETKFSCKMCDADLLLPLSATDILNSNSYYNSYSNSYGNINTISNLIVNNEGTITAYRQKDKLLLFDKENAKRTHVHDSQGDYYTSSVWLSEEEKSEIIQKEIRRKEKKSKLLNRTIHITVDIAGRKVIECKEPDYRDTDNTYDDSNSDVANYSNGRYGTESSSYYDGANYDGTNYYSGDISNSFSKVSLDSKAYSTGKISADTNTTKSLSSEHILSDGYTNTELELRAGKAADIYRQMKERWDENDKNGKVNSKKSDGKVSTRKTNKKTKIDIDY